MSAETGSCYASGMKPLKTKAQVREEIEQQIEEFLLRGGAVDQIARGESGRDITTQPPVPVAFDGPKTERTLVNDVVAAIESRRKPKPIPKAPRAKPPRKKVILDDFGQPLRWEWVED